MPSLTIVGEDADDKTAGTAMALQLQYVAFIAFAGLMAIAAFEDLRRLLIPNVLPLALCLLWPMSLLPAPSLVGALGAIGCALAIFIAGAFCFSRGFLGGGDVKLLTAATLWAGPSQTPSLLVLTGVLGGGLALFLLVPPGAQLATLARAKLGPATDTPEQGQSTPVPYGIAIAAAAVIVICLPHFQ
jgi:prepilin peptidase CpaA